MATSVRDILQENRKPKRLEETVDILNRYFDLVLVHGDPRFCELGDTFPLANTINPEIIYTGIVSGNRPDLRDEPHPGPSGEEFDVIVSAGGGAVGESVLQASVAARPFTSLASARWLFVTGPNYPDKAFGELQKISADRVSVARYRGDLATLLYKARISISQCGYNTIADILQARCASVVIPFSVGGETEQTRRAEALSARGRLAMLSEESVSPEKLAAAFEIALSYSPEHDDLDIKLDGAARSAAILRRSLG